MDERPLGMLNRILNSYNKMLKGRSLMRLSHPIELKPTQCFRNLAESKSGVIHPIYWVKLLDFVKLKLIAHSVEVQHLH